MAKIRYIQSLEDIFSEAKRVVDANVYRAVDVLKDLKNIRSYGEPEGEFAGYKSLHPHLRFRKGYVVCFTGYPGSGKSQLLAQFATIQAKDKGRKIAMYSPESYPIPSLVNELIRCYLGKNIDKKYANCCSDQEYKDGVRFVNNHFFFLKYPDIPRLDQLLTDYQRLIEDEGVEIVITDPFNAIAEGAYGDGVSKYLKTALTQMKMFADDMNVFNWIVEHPKNPTVDKNGNIPLATPWMLYGGSMWWNKMDTIVSVARQHDNNYSEVRVWKMKLQRLNGVPNPNKPVMLAYQIEQNRYLETGIYEQAVEEVIN